jgi:hypothetical protein
MYLDDTEYFVSKRYQVLFYYAVNFQTLAIIMAFSVISSFQNILFFMHCSFAHLLIQ